MKVKICGVTHPEDAVLAASLGADYIGLIFSPVSKRCVSVEKGKEIAEVARQAGAEPVAVFVHETAEEIEKICRSTGVCVVQLHGKKAREAYGELLYRQKLRFIYAVPVERSGCFSNEFPDPSSSDRTLFLFDCLTGGTGRTFDWESFSPPKGCNWILAGGLNPENVVRAIDLLRPQIVDVASGVEFPASTRKDPQKTELFIQRAKQHEEFV